MSVAAHTASIRRGIALADRGIAAAFAATRRPIEDRWGAAGHVVRRLTTRAGHTGEFHGSGATEREIGMTVLVIDRSRDGRIVKPFGGLEVAGRWRPRTAPAVG